MSIKVDIYNQKGERTGEMELTKEVFGVKVSESLVHQAMVAQMANARQVLAHTKVRSEVRGGGKKPWKQKGTGRARAGSSRSPLWIGGGVIFGPRKNRNFELKINKKMKQQALLMALSDKAANKNLVVLDKLEMADYKTKAFNEILNKLEGSVLTLNIGKNSDEKKVTKRSFLILNVDGSDKLHYSARNLEGVKVINLDNINLLDLLKLKNLLVTVEALNVLSERYGKKK